MIQKNLISPVYKDKEKKVTRPLGMRCLLKIKDNGRYSERLVSKGFLQREWVE